MSTQTHTSQKAAPAAHAVRFRRNVHPLLTSLKLVTPRETVPGLAGWRGGAGR